MDIQLKENGYINFDGGRLTLIRDRGSLVAQRLSVRLRTYFQEWFLDTRMGIDWFADVLLKNVSKQTVDNIIQSEVLKDQYVVSVNNFSSKIVDRNYSCEFSVSIVGLEYEVQLRYLANENNFYVVDENGNYLVIEI